MASNKLLRSRFEAFAKFFSLSLSLPPPHHCTDNGTMIAWAGMERLKALEAGRFEPWVEGDWMKGGGVYWDDSDQCQMEPMPRLPIGRDFCRSVEESKIKVKRDYSRVSVATRRAFFQRQRHRLQAKESRM